MRTNQCVLFDLTNMKHTAAACGTADAHGRPPSCPSNSNSCLQCGRYTRSNDDPNHMSTV